MNQKFNKALYLLDKGKYNDGLELLKSAFDEVENIYEKLEIKSCTMEVYYELEEFEKAKEGFFPIREISPEGNEYAYSYDCAGRKTRAESAAGSVHFAYNGLNHITCTTDGEGNAVHDDYDNLGIPIRHHSARQWEKDRSGGYAYEYDYLDRLVRITDPAGRVKTFRRNGQGSIVYESLLSMPVQAPENGMVQGITSTYDANENLICMTCPDGGEWHTEYDSEGNLTHDRRPGGMAERRYTYDAMNRKENDF